MSHCPDCGCTTARHLEDDPGRAPEGEQVDLVTALIRSVSAARARACPSQAARPWS